MPLHVSSTFAHRQEAKIVLYNHYSHLDGHVLTSPFSVMIPEVV